jgi:hypothetical protein
MLFIRFGILGNDGLLAPGSPWPEIFRQAERQQHVYSLQVRKIHKM